ncbi:MULTISPECIES: hypothetical protein [Bacilli]|uniref:hypothetical protein n=1 Tax=Bacilli TaxID=91061 RepID=UPI00203F947C|nr:MULTISPECIES: hypothetical protein [Bacilli]MCM3032910.1 hypothetical protein [Niallia sp. MER 6]MDK8746874.1 hypothetical protein [Streptococcus agalactiae]
MAEQKKLKNQERVMFIEILAMKTGIKKEYFERISDSDLEYEYLSQLEDHREVLSL